MQPIGNPFTISDVALRIGVAVLVGAVLGVNRDLRDKPAGLKTHALVTVGSAMITMVSIAFASAAGLVDPGTLSRVTQGIITGIGFIGAGVIMRGETARSVQGLTTAATIWVAACLGIACGAAQWSIVGVAFAATLLVLILGDPLEQAIYRRWHGRPSDDEDR